MKRTKFMTLPALFAGLAIATVFAPYAHAGCGLYRPVAHGVSWQTHAGAPRFLRAAMSDDEDAAKKEPSIVGTWKEHWISEGSEGIPDGTEVDAGYSQWQSDGNEINVSGLRAPLTGDVCLGVWKKTGERTYRMNHFGIAYDSTGQNLVGPGRIKQWLTLAPSGKTTSGWFTIDQYDESGNLLAHVQGKITGTRVDLETEAESVE